MQRGGRVERDGPAAPFGHNIVVARLDRAIQ